MTDEARIEHTETGADQAGALAVAAAERWLMRGVPDKRDVVALI